MVAHVAFLFCAPSTCVPDKGGNIYSIYRRGCGFRDIQLGVRWVCFMLCALCEMGEMGVFHVVCFV